MQKRLTREGLNKKQKSTLYKMRNHRIRQIKLLKEKIGIYNKEVEIIDEKIKKLKELNKEDQ